MADELTSAAAQPPAVLSEAARRYINASARPNTRRAYAAQLRQWMAWCEQNGRPAFPADTSDVANYLAERGSVGQSVSTLRTVVAAIKDWGERHLAGPSAPEMVAAE